MSVSNRQPRSAGTKDKMSGSELAKKPAANGKTSVRVALLPLTDRSYEFMLQLLHLPPALFLREPER